MNRCIVLAALFAVLSGGAVAEEYDLVIYGGTPAGISAAVQAKRSGLKAVMIEPSRRIGGLTTGGLGRTDIGSKDGFGGIAREFYRDVAAWYRDPAHWTRQTREDFAARMKAIDDRRFVPDEDAMWCFEPSAALAILEGWERRDGLEFVRGERLDRGPNGVLKRGGRIVSVRMESGRVFGGKMFIDATYEGDLLAAAGVQYTVGREDNSVYGETINGVQRGLGGHKLRDGVDPYVMKGDPSSGILPGVEAAADDPRPNGSGDGRVQAYCYRMCLTDDPGNRIPFKKPAGYDEREYELLFRNVEQGDVKVHRNQGPLPNRKTDTNNDGGFSTDYIGQSWEWAEASYAEREKIALRHLNYQQGLMWVLANHPRIPPDVREEYRKWGTCRDEFVGERGDGWQCQLYVREARRMVGEYVMTEHNCRRHVKAPRPIAYASYTMDSHHCRRYIGGDGFVHNEGDVQDSTLYPLFVDGVEQPYVGFGRYGVDYGALVPKKKDCENLLVPVCVSCSHIAYGSIRMEPVFFSFGQSAAVAAARAIRDNVAVQDVDYEGLRADLTAAGQLLPPAPAPRRSCVSVEIRGWGRVDAVCDVTAQDDATVRYACATPEIARQLAAKRRADLLSFGDERELSRYDVEAAGREVVERYVRNHAMDGLARLRGGDLSYPHWLGCLDRRGADARCSEVPEVRAWCEEHADLVRAIGKLSLPQPDMAGLRSSRSQRPGFVEGAIAHDTGIKIWGEGLWGSRRESRNGVYDVYLVTRMELPGEGVKPIVSGKVGFLPPDAEHGWVTSPPHGYQPMETLMFRVPRLDACSAGLRWLAALAETLHPVETVPPPAGKALETHLGGTRPGTRR